MEWSRKVPAFFPSFSKFKKSTISFSLKSVLRREYSGVFATVIGFVYVEAFIRFRLSGSFMVNKNFLYILGATAVVTLILRSLKHYTGLLSEEGRS